MTSPYVETRSLSTGRLNIVGRRGCGTVRDLATGTDLAFRPLGSVSLRGVPGLWELFSASMARAMPLAEAEQCVTASVGSWPDTSSPEGHERRLFDWRADIATKARSARIRYLPRWRSSKGRIARAH